MSFLSAEEPLVAPFAVPEREHWWSAAVTVSGAWSGQVTVEISAAAAVAVTSVMLATEDVGAEDVTDAVGELVNMVGGNVKAALPGPSGLSLPDVGEAPAVRNPEDVCRIDVLWRGQPLSVSVQGALPPLPVAQPHNPENGASL
jgi:hypothetical protein